MFRDTVLVVVSSVVVTKGVVGAACTGEVVSKCSYI